MTQPHALDPADIGPDTFRALHELAVAIAGTLDLAVVAQLVVDWGRDLLEADSATLYDWDEASDVLRPLAYNDFARVGPPASRAPTNSLAGAVLATRTPLIVDDLAAWRRDHGFMAGRMLAAPALAMPLLVSDRSVGVITVRGRQGTVFNESHVAILTLLAAQVAPALEAARLHGESERRREEAEALAEVVRRGAAAERQLLREVAASEQRFRSLYEAMSCGVVVRDREGYVVQANAAAQEMLGLTFEEMQAAGSRGLWKSNESTLDGDMPAHWAFHTAMNSGRPVRREPRRITCWDNQVRWLQVDTVPMLGAAGETDHIVTSLLDVTAQKEAEELLRSSEELHRRIVEAAQEGIWIFDANAIATFANDRAAEMLGYDVDQLVGASVFDFLWDGARHVAAANLEGARQGHLGRYDTRFRRQDGTELWATASLVPLFDATQTFIGFLSMVTDITERRRAEVALRESEARFRRFAEHAEDVIYRYELRPRHGMSYVSPAAEHILGYTAAECDADPLLGLRLVHHEDRPSFVAAIRDMAARRGPGTVVGRLRCKDGGWVWLEQRLVPVYGEANELVAFEGIARDVTQRKALEEELLHAQRLEEAGRLAGQVAHDFNNLLAPLVGYPELIKMRLPEGHPGIQFCDAMVEAAQHMADINEDLMTLARRGLAKQEPVDLNHLVGRAAEHLAGQPSSLTVQFDLASDLQAVQGSGPQLLRVISNLISNARDAMGDVGILAIGTENVTLDRALGTYPRVEPGPYVRLSVEDTGSGIDQAILDRIFDAFFTTKPPGKRTGSGLGLSIVQSLVADHHGAIEVESELGRGTTFHIYLPATRQSPRERRNEPAPHGNEAILVVDDDAGQREVSRRVLEMLGYQVAVVTSGEEAVDALREKPADLLVLDMILEGGIDGAETYRRVLEEWPAQRAIILSGFAESARVQAAQALGAGAYIRKPATIERLARAVRAELDRPSGERRVVLDEEEIPPQ